MDHEDCELQHEIQPNELSPTQDIPTTDHDVSVLQYHMDYVNHRLQMQINFYERLPYRTLLDERVLETVINIKATMDAIQCDVPTLTKLACQHDFDITTPGNGFRSLVNILSRGCYAIRSWLDVLEASREYTSTLEAAYDQLYNFGLQMFRLLGSTIDIATSLGKVLPQDQLFFRDRDHPLFRNINTSLHSTARRHYFGDAFAFYHTASVKSVLQIYSSQLKGLGLCMVGYSHGANFQNSLISLLASIGFSASYFFRPTTKAVRFLEATQSGSIEFTKRFWNLAESFAGQQIFGHKSLKVAQSLDLVVDAEVLDDSIGIGESQIELQDFTQATSTRCTMPRLENFHMDPHPSLYGRWDASCSPARVGITIKPTTWDGRPIEDSEDNGCDDSWMFVDVTEQLTSSNNSSSEIPRYRSRASACTSLDDWIFDIASGDTSKIVRTWLYSACEFTGQPCTADPLQQRRTEGAPPARELLFHIHGGGFVAQSPKSHEIYLERWAQQLQCPIFSVDYSLAPEAQYPTAVQECFFAYRWALRHADVLGTTAERICVVGDSAGGTLVTSLVFRCILENIRRPDAAVLIYPALELELSASPSRLLTSMDPLLPEGVLRNCLEAYTGVAASEFRTQDPLLNPMCAPTELLERCCPFHIIAAGLDPLLDDSVTFAKLLREAGAPVTLRIFQNMPHGFLMFPTSAEDVRLAYSYCCDVLCSILLGEISEAE